MIDDATYVELLGFVEDELTTAEQESLIRRLQASPQLADELLRIAADDVRLRAWSRTKCNSTRSLEPADRRQVFAPLRRLYAAALALAAMLLLMLSAAVVHLSNRAAGPPRSSGKQPATSSQRLASSDITTTIARIADVSRGAEWFIENLIHRDNRRISSGDTLRVNRGQIDVRFIHGTLVTLRAPAILEIHDSMSTRVHRGSIRVDVAKGAEGFQVATPLARVIDLGTKFGVDVDDEGRTEVAVFEGAVDVQGGVDEQAHLPKLQRLRAGEAVSLDSRGTVSRVVTIAGDRFPNSGGSYRPPDVDRPLLISQVRDNIARDAGYKFYEIVRAGMREDARAFVDRPYHEWNGLTSAGLPAYLAQGDYVKTFNSDKMNPQIQIQLTLARPAIVYLLMDDRVPIPGWLPKLFQDTGDGVGLDEGYDVSPTNQKIAVGAGQSVDNTFSVWKRIVPRPGVLRLGAIEKLAPGPNPSWINMYGVVAVPLTP